LSVDVPAADVGAAGSLGRDSTPPPAGRAGAALRPSAVAWLAFALGLSSFFMLPVVGDIKPFDLLAVALFLAKVRAGVSLQRNDLAFAVFIACCFASLSTATLVVESSLLQTLRYAFFFLLARINFAADEQRLLVRGLKASILLNSLWIVVDLAWYYTLGECESLNVWVFAWVSQITTHRYPIDVFGCPILRPTGFTWDPGGLFPIMLITAHAFKSKALMGITSFFSLVAVSRTALLTALGLWLGGRAPRTAWVALFLAVLVVPFFTIIYAHELLDDFTDGTLRHLAYPGLAILGIIDDPRYLFLGDGIRGGGKMFMQLNHPIWSDFFPMDELLSGTARNMVIESIWINQLTGAGAIGAVAYGWWLIRGLQDSPALLIGLLVAGLYYTFDSSMFCFVVPLLMTSVRPAAAAFPRRGTLT
jgi:hypothetical protein